MGSRRLLYQQETHEQIVDMNVNKLLNSTLKKPTATMSTKITSEKSPSRPSLISPENVAKKTGLLPCVVREVMRGAKCGSRLRRRVEVALGHAVWSSKAEFARQQALTKWLQFDPLIEVQLEVKRRARAKGILIRGQNPMRAEVLTQLFAAYEAAHPKPPRSGVTENTPPLSAH